MKTFTSPRALKNLVTIGNALIELGSVTTAELSALTGLTKNSIGGYLHYMEANGAAHCSEPAVKNHRGNTSAKWSAGKVPAITSDDTDDMPVTIVEVTHWTPQLKRDPYALPANFFGSARA